MCCPETGPVRDWGLGCLQVMKRVRTEQIQYAVAQFLKRRQYVDTESSLKGAKLFQSAEEMAASLTGGQTDKIHLIHSLFMAKNVPEITTTSVTV